MDLPLINDFSTVTDSGCTGCSVAYDNTLNTLTATIKGGADTLDTAYGVKDFGGTSGWSGRTYSRTIVGFPAGQAAIAANLAVFQEWDVSGKLVYELYVSNVDKTLRLWSPAGGLNSYSLNYSTNIVVPTGSSVRAEVSALANSSVIVRVNGTDKITLTGLSGANTGNPRYLRAGIDHYDTATTNEVVKFSHQNVGITTLDWLGTRTTPNSAPPINTAIPQISGLTQSGQTLSATNGTWTGTPTPTYTYQWQRCDSAGNNCVNQPVSATTYLLSDSDVGSTIKVLVTATNSAGTATASSVVTSAIAPKPIAPTDTSVPTITGNAIDGQTLSATNGTWTGTPTPTYTYQWQRCDNVGQNCGNIAGATSQTYNLISNDIGKTVTVSVTATNSAGNSTATSIASAVVQGIPPSNTSSPVISGNVLAGQTLTVSDGSWNGTAVISYTYQWMKCDANGANCSDINGATANTYTVNQNDQGYVLCAGVTAQNAYGSASAASADTNIVPTAPTVVSAPTISGTLQDGQTLSATSGTWNGTAPISYAYQWQQCQADGSACSNISGATGQTYTLTSSDISHVIQVAVTASNQAGAATATSAQTTQVNAAPLANSAVPTISGILQYGHTLSVSNGSWTGSQPITYTYQWQRCDSSGANCTDISGATSSSYILTRTDVSMTVSATVTATNIAGPMTAVAAPTAAVTLPILTLPSSIAALGDSLTEAYGSDGSQNDIPANSWATGTNTSVNSQYLRILSRSGSISGNNFNYAVSGSQMISTITQADSAIAKSAGFITILSGTNDACRPTIAEMTSVSSYSASLQSTLSKITSALPNTQILISSIPNWYSLWQTYQNDSTAQTAWSYYNDRCPDLLSMGANETDRQAVSQRIQDYNAVINQVCSQIVNCTYDGGAVYNLSFVPSDMAFDFFHFSPSGQAKIAQSLWNAGPYANTSVVADATPPSNTSLPVITGSAISGQTLTVSKGSWNSNAPVTYSYQWQRCDTLGANCVDITNAQTSTYLISSTDINNTLRAKVIASNAFGQNAATSVVTAKVIPPPPTTDIPVISDFSPVTDSGCSGCSVSWNGTTNTLTSTIAGGADNLDTAYGLKDFGGTSGWNSRTYARTWLGFPSGQTNISANLAVMQEWDTNSNLIYEIWIRGSDRQLCVYSPTGGLGPYVLGCTGIVVPTGSQIRVEVSAKANDSFTIRIDDVDRYTLTGLNGATTTAPRYLLAGEHHYDASSTNETVRMTHQNTGITTYGWFGTRTTPYSSPPVSTVTPSVTGPNQTGGILTTTNGSWDGDQPITYAYQWQRCDASGANCVDISGAINAGYTTLSADQGSTIRAKVIASNVYGTAVASSSPTGVIVAPDPVNPSYFFSRNIIDPTAGQCSGCATNAIDSGDINGDNKPDVVVGGASAIVWYTNPGAINGSWQRATIASGKFGAGSELLIRDMNNDGRNDVVVGEFTSTIHQEVWFENTGTSWTKHVMSTNAYCHDIEFADMDSDGKVDAVCTNQETSQVTWLKAPTDVASAWGLQTIDPNRWVMGIEVADLNKDGKPDLVAGRAWYENTGVYNAAWSRHPYTNLADSVNPMFNDGEEVNVMDLNGDGMLDIVATLFAESPEGQVWAFLSPADPTGTWTCVQIDSGPLFGVHSQSAKNFDGTGRPQIMVAETNFGGWSFGTNSDPQVYIYRLVGPADQSSSWQRIQIDNTGTHEAEAADIDGDGKIDIFGQQENTDRMTPAQNGPVQVWQNRTVY